MPTVLQIGHGRFVLDPDVDVERVRAEIVAAVRSGGDLLHLLHSRGSSDVLISQTTPVRLDYLPARSTQLPATTEDTDITFVDFDLDL